MESQSILPPPPPPEDASAPPPPPEDLPPPPPEPEVKKKKVGWGTKRPATTPLSVEELVRKKREADAAAARVRPYTIDHTGSWLSCYLKSDLMANISFYDF